ncbi:MAG: glycosyltransferase [Terriglobia bacterium]
MNATVPPAPKPIALDDYAAVVGASEINDLRTLARQLAGRSLKMVNSTAVGGGVAEILNRLVPLLNELGLPTRREVMTGGDDFFEVTKGFHNALHGARYEPHPQAFEIFRAYTEQNLSQMEFNEDFIVIHDPQPAGLIQAQTRNPAAWIWRCHIDVSHPHPGVWDFLHQYVRRYHATIFSSENFARGFEIPQYLFYPSIDPLSEKNRDLEPAFIQQTLEKFHIDPQLPILTQVSRFDRLKDPLGVIEAYRMVRRYLPCQLVLVGGGAKDDPEGGLVLDEVRSAAANDSNIHILDLPPWSALEINALQHASTIIIQKSLREGFGLTVTEGLWKKKPVVASAVGGIPAQVIHKITGMLTHSVEGTAFQIRYLLSNPAFAQQLAENGQAHVRANFLITSNLKRYLLLCILLARR